MADLNLERDALQTRIIDKVDATTIIRGNWPEADRLIRNWWGAYEEWEGRATFNTAVAEHRMTMRSFGSNFEKQLTKTIPMNIAENDRFYANSDRKKLSRMAQGQHQQAFQLAVTPTAPMFGWSKKNPEPAKVYANPYRGLDTTPFANPANFATREEKYKLGLHDLSVKLFISGADVATYGVKEQSHHQEQANPHFCFLPLSKPEDQYVIFKLIQYAKELSQTVPALYTLIREIRGKMTRVKLAHHYDMGTGYIAVPTPTGTLPYKVSFSVGNSEKLRLEDQTEKKQTTPMTIETLRARRKAYFEQNAKVLKLGNEFVIAMRRHNGPFPVYAYYDGGALKCFDIVGGERKPNGHTISALGVFN